VTVTTASRRPSVEKEAIVGIFDKAKAAAEQAAAKAKEGVEDVQVKRELGQAYGELGKTAFELVESGAIAHPSLDEVVAKIRGLNEKAAGDTEAPAADAGVAEQPADESQGAAA
jgi:hypothetical protein